MLRYRHRMAAESLVRGPSRGAVESPLLESFFMSNFVRKGDAPGLLRMAMPLVISFWMRAAFSLVDTIYAATIGDEAVAAIGLTFPFEFLLIALWVGLSTGLTSSLSRAMGARQGECIAAYKKAALRLVMVTSPLIGAIGVGIWFVAPHLDLEPGVARAFRIYGTVMLVGSAATSFWSVIPDSIIKAHQDTRTTMWAGILSNVINVVLNTIFLFVFEWGVFGIALSTVIGRLGGLLLAMRRASEHERRRVAEDGDGLPGCDRHPYHAILTLAVPSGLVFSLMAVETGLINQLLTTLDHPTEALAAYSIYFRVVLFMLNPVIAAGVAMLPFAARRLGAGDEMGVRQGLRQAGIMTFVFTVFLVLPVSWLGAPFAAAALTESLIAERFSIFALRLVPIAVLVTAPAMLVRPVFEAMGRGRPGLLMALLRHVLLALPAAWLGVFLAKGAGFAELNGLLIGLLAATTLVSLVFAGWLRVELARPWRQEP